MEIIYKCGKCGQEFDSSKKCDAHEKKCKAVKKPAAASKNSIYKMEAALTMFNVAPSLSVKISRENPECPPFCGKPMEWRLQAGWDDGSLPDDIVESGRMSQKNIGCTLLHDGIIGLFQRKTRKIMPAITRRVICTACFKTQDELESLVDELEKSVPTVADMMNYLQWQMIYQTEGFAAYDKDVNSIIENDFKCTFIHRDGFPYNISRSQAWHWDIPLFKYNGTSISKIRKSHKDAVPAYAVSISAAKDGCLDDIDIISVQEGVVYSSGKTKTPVFRVDDKDIREIKTLCSSVSDLEGGAMFCQSMLSSSSAYSRGINLEGGTIFIFDLDDLKKAAEKLFRQYRQYHLQFLSRKRQDIARELPACLDFIQSKVPETLSKIKHEFCGDAANGGAPLKKLGSLKKDELAEYFAGNGI